MKNLNWSGWAFTMLLCMLAAASNEKVNSILQWSIVVIAFGFPLSLFPLIAGRKKPQSNN